MTNPERKIIIVGHADPTFSRAPNLIYPLTKKGEERADALVDGVICAELGRGALILSSVSPPAIETARRIANMTGYDLIASEYFKRAGELPEAVKSVEDMLEHAAEKIGDPRIAENNVALVTHRQLIAAMIGHEDPKTLEYGLFLYHTSNSWENPRFDPGLKKILRHDFAE